MGRKRTKWTPEEDETLKGMWPTEELDLIAMHLERTQGSVSGRAWALGLRREKG